MKIFVINPVFSKVTTAEEAKFISSLIFVRGSKWIEGQFEKKEIATTKPLINKGIFLTGFIPRIIADCKTRNVKCEIILQPNNSILASEPIEKIKIPSDIKELASEQIEAIKAMINNHRGVIHYPTGSGKTVIILGFLSLYPIYNSLIIVNTQDLLLQTIDRAEELFPGEVGIIGNGTINPNRITITTIQTLYQLNLDDFGKSINIVIVDECHHCSELAKPFVRTAKEEGTYAKVLTQIMASKRFGLTGTLPYIHKAKMALEGYIGPVIITKNINEINRLAKVIVKLIKLPETTTIRGSKKPYDEIYKLGVIFNSRRNKTILIESEKLIKEDRTILILVTAIQHGHNIMNLAKRSFPHLKMKFVWSGIASKDRNEIKKQFNNKEYDIIIADAVWKEGIDIPTLGAIINGAGGKSEIVTIQSIGRGLRRVEGIKEDVVLIDFFDPSHRFLRDHFAERLTLYFDLGWMER